MMRIIFQVAKTHGALFGTFFGINLVYRTKTRKLARETSRDIRRTWTKNKTQQSADSPVTLASKISVAMFRFLCASGELPVQKE